jgi:hypothetical protein
MNKFLFILFASVSAFAWDSAPGNFTGKYKIVQSEVCSSYGTYYTCLVSTDLAGKTLEIVQSKVNEEYVVCINKNFSDYLTNNHCYKNSAKNNSILQITSSGFKAENVEIRNGRKVTSTYSHLTRSGTEYLLKDGGSVKELFMYYKHTLEKVNN